MVMAKREKRKVFLIAISIILSIVTFIATMIGLNNLATTEKLNRADYSIGTISETGSIIDSKKSAYTKDMYNAEEIKITLDENAQITYRVVFYDEDENFVSTTENLTEDYNVATTPENAKYFRVVITPNQVDEEDVKLNIFNVNKYTSMLEVEYKK